MKQNWRLKFKFVKKERYNYIIFVCINSKQELFDWKPVKLTFFVSGVIIITLKVYRLLKTDVSTGPVINDGVLREKLTE